MAKKKANKPEPKVEPKKNNKEKKKDAQWFSLFKSFFLALVLALLVRVLVFEIFKIPSCSMEPTLEGVDMSHGDRVGVNKLAYTFSDINRYDVIVFEADSVVNGKRISRDYIKRVTGFPGERLSLRAGDLIVNNKIAPKPEEVQESIWIPIYEEEFSAPDWKRYWQQESGKWSLENDALLCESGTLKYLHWERTLKDGKPIYGFISNLLPRLSIFEEVICPNGNERFTPHYRDCFVETDLGTGTIQKGFICPKCGGKVFYEGRNGDNSQPTRGVMGTDFWLGGNAIVGDLSFEADITPQVRTGHVSILIERGQKGGKFYSPHSIELPIGPGSQPLYKNIDGSKNISEASRLQMGTTSRVTFSIWDGMISIKINGKPVLNTTFMISERDLDGNGISITLSDKTKVVIDNIKINRDIHYLAVDIDKSVNPTYISKGEYQVPEDRYFVMGDNSPASNDCRVKMMPIPIENIVGRAFGIIWPPRNWRMLPSVKSSDK